MVVKFDEESEFHSYDFEARKLLRDPLIVTPFKAQKWKFSTLSWNKS